MGSGEQSACYNSTSTSGVHVHSGTSLTCFCCVAVHHAAVLQGDFNSEWVSVYITLPGVGEAKDRVSCTFGQRAFDLQVAATKTASAWPLLRQPYYGRIETYCTLFCLAVICDCCGRS
jgi:hypothetical protein